MDEEELQTDEEVGETVADHRSIGHVSCHHGHEAGQEVLDQNVMTDNLEEDSGPQEQLGNSHRELCSLQPELAGWKVVSYLRGEASILGKVIRNLQWSQYLHRKSSSGM